jgi:type IV secretory pathway VirJ component
MKHGLGAGALLLLLSAAIPARAEPVETLTAPGLGQVTVYSPAGPPSEVVLFVSGDGGWNLGVVSMAEQLRGRGALVAGIDVRSFVKSLDAQPRCGYPAGTLEELSRAVQLHHRLPAYKRPILVGYSSGATLVYAALVAAPPETFAGAISLGFCPDLDVARAPCSMRGLVATRRTKGVGYDLGPFADLRVPWMVLQGEVDQVCSPATTQAFVKTTGSARLFLLPKVGHGFSVPRNWAEAFIEAYEAVRAGRKTQEAENASSPEIADLPLVEVPAAGGEDGSKMAVILTGDGGWAEIDKSIGAGLAAAGVPVVGWSSLSYYWTPRTPEAAAADLARIIEHYSGRWRKPRVVLVGYSFGADVLPFLVNRLPDAVRARVASATLLGLSEAASFEFHVASWIGGGGGPTHPTLPEVRRAQVPITCVRGHGESDSACLPLEGSRVSVVEVGEGHHFGGEYARLVDVILRSGGSGP